MEETIGVYLHNRFDIMATDAETGETRQIAQAENIILNQAWDQIFAETSWFTHIHYGIGSGEPNILRIALFSPLSLKACDTTLWSENIAENWYSLRRSIVLQETEHVGSIISEVGIGTATVLSTHALLRDMNGNLVTITKAATDIITIFATTYLRVPAWSTGGPIVLRRIVPASDAILSGNPLVQMLLGLRITLGTPGYTATPGFPNAIQAQVGDCSSPAGGNTGKLSVTKTIDVINKRVTLYLRIPAATGNMEGYKSYSVGWILAWNIATPSCFISHISADTLTQAAITEQIGIGNGSNVLFATTFPFVKTGAVIKVDGVAQPASVKTGVPKIKNILDYLISLGNTGNGSIGFSNYFPSTATTEQLILENPYYVTNGIDSITGTAVKISTSDDMVTWTQIYSVTGTGTHTVAAAHKQKRYWKCEMAVATAWKLTAVNIDAFDALKNVTMAVAPATGAVITAEYTTDVAAKDINHVMDITVVIQLGEYTP